MEATNTSKTQKLSGIKKFFKGAKNFFGFIFGSKTLKAVGNTIAWFLRGVFRVLGITYTVGMWVFGVLTVLLGYGVFSSVMSVINMEGLIVLPLLWGIIKLAFFCAVAYGWFSFYMASSPYRRANDVKDKAETAYNIGKAATKLGKNEYDKFKEKQKVKSRNQ
ncbi:MAG: hypothetical protein P8J32_07515 [bacterium]|nr:hypothetical protein [bacterium]